VKKLSRSNMPSYLKRNRWLWTPIAIIALLTSIVTIPVILVVENIGDVKDAYAQTIKVMFHWVEHDSE